MLCPILELVMQMTRLTIRLFTLGALGLALTSPAEAQFGGLIKKAQDKVVQKAEDKVGPVVAGEQLTDDLLSKVIVGAQVGDRKLEERDRLQAAKEAKNQEYSALVEKNQPVHRSYDEVSGKINDCRSSSLSALSQAREDKYEAAVKARESDPALMGKMQLIAMKYGPRMQEAQQKQDAVALTKIQKEMMAEVLGVDVFADTKKDSVATDAKCGKEPAKPASLVQEARMQKELQAMDDQIRTLEAQALTAGAQAAGIEQVRYGQLKERALVIMARVEGKGSGKFGDEEMAAVRKRLADLEKVKRAL